MRAPAYPWGWLERAVGSTFSLRFPWRDGLRAVAAKEEAVCLLVPEVVGPLEDWGDWVEELLGPPVRRVRGGDFAEVGRRLEEWHEVDPGAVVRDTASSWARTFLAACRREVAHPDTTPMVVVGATDGCATGLASLLEAQRAINYPSLRPVLVRRTEPPGWAGTTVRFGLPEVGGDLHRIDPPPGRDLTFWTGLVLALTAAWEAGAVPGWADDLFERLHAGRMPSLRDAGFDEWLAARCRDFAQVADPAGVRWPAGLPFGPLGEVDDGLWQRGVVGFDGERYDVTPLWGRRWPGLRPDEAEALRRRRLTNVPLARWLSAWAASVEESLRVAVFAGGTAAFEQYLRKGKPRWSEGGTRWDELGQEGPAAAVDRAEFKELASFLSRDRSSQAGRDLERLLGRCRDARNRVVHERRLQMADLIGICDTVGWLAARGLI